SACWTAPPPTCTAHRSRRCCAAATGPARTTRAGTWRSSTAGTCCPVRRCARCTSWSASGTPRRGGRTGRCSSARTCPGSGDPRRDPAAPTRVLPGAGRWTPPTGTCARCPRAPRGRDRGSRRGGRPLDARCAPALPDEERAMTVSSHRLVDRRTVRGALALAAAAPSVRNSQPWRWEVGRDAVHLHADLARWLPAADPMGRDLVMSCGAALHHARVALAATGLACSVQRMPDLDTPTHLATLRLHPRAAEATDLALAAAVLRRRTDRRPFADWEVPGEFVDELCERAAEQGAELRPVTAPRARQRLLRAIAEAARMPEGKDDDLLPEATDPEYEAVAGLPDG